MKIGVCSWCHKDVVEQDFREHANEHLSKQAHRMSLYGQGSITAISDVAYYLENLPKPAA